MYCAWDKRFLPPDASPLLWQEKEDGSWYNGMSERDYLELLDWGPQDLHANLDGRRALGWKEWEERLREASAGWRKPPESTKRKRHCPRHKFDALERINMYTLEGKCCLTRAYPSQFS